MIPFVVIFPFFTYKHLPECSLPGVWEWPNKNFAGFQDEDSIRACGAIQKPALDCAVARLVSRRRIRSVENKKFLFSLDLLVLLGQAKRTIKTIEQANKRIDFVYGPDQSRKVMRYYEKEGGTFVLKKTKYYILGNTEIEVDNVSNETRTLNYIAGKAILEQSPTEEKLYYLHYDYQGSLQTVTDESGGVVQRYAYDPWGRRRDPGTWRNLTASEIEQESFLFDRGYTGHEHLDMFGLINMNGRMYDPLLGRMLSPDNYVQAPGNSQNFNRYSYALNNPLVYTDPSGEFFLLPAMMVGAFINVVMQGWSGNAQTVGDFALSFGIGAAAGALGAGVGTGIQTASAGASFWAGFVGSAEGISTILGAGYASSFFTGALAGGAGGFASGFTLGLGNGFVQNQNIGQATLSGLEAGGWGALSGGLIGGVAGGIDAAIDSRNFFNGGPNAPEKLEILYKRAVSNGITSPENGAVGSVKVGKSPGLAHRTGGDVRYFEERMTTSGMEIRKMGRSNNDLVFTRRIVRRMWRGNVPLEAINHEVIHANDYFNASWWNESNAAELILDSNKLRKWLELRALEVNMQRSDWHVFKDYYQYWMGK